MGLLESVPKLTDSADQSGQIDASTATTEGAQKGEEMIMVAKRPVVDVGVQTEDL